MISRACVMRALVVLVLLSCVLLPARAGTEEIKAKAAAARAAISDEELARQIRENTITDADLLPTRGPAKAYTPTGAPEFGLLLTPGIGKGCNLKKFPNLRAFLKNEAKFYPELVVDYQIATDPRLKFYASKQQRDDGMIHGSTMSADDLLALLVAGPDASKEPLLNVELSETDPSPEELAKMLEAHGIMRAMVPDENHSSTLIFKPGFVPIED